VRLFEAKVKTTPDCTARFDSTTTFGMTTDVSKILRKEEEHILRKQANLTVSMRRRYVWRSTDFDGGGIEGEG